VLRETERIEKQGLGTPRPGDWANQCAVETSRPMTHEEIVDEIFKYHSPTSEQIPHYENIREGARHFARIILLNVPSGPDRTAAIRLLREAVMTANAAIALNGLAL